MANKNIYKWNFTTSMKKEIGSTFDHEASNAKCFFFFYGNIPIDSYLLIRFH